MDSPGSQASPQPPEPLDLASLLPDPAFNAAKLLQLDNIVEQVRKQSELLTQKLLLRQDIINDLIEICVRPDRSACLGMGAMGVEHTNRAVEVLTNLSDEFSYYLAGRASNSDQEQTAVAAQMLPSLAFAKIIAMLQNSKPLAETPLQYLYKISISACYHNQRNIMALLSEEQCGVVLMDHLYSYSITEWIIKLLEMEDSSSFFQAEKVKIFSFVVDSVKNEQDPELKTYKLQNYESILAAIIQKLQDRFDKSKYISMSKALFSTAEPISFLLTDYETQVLSPAPILLSILDKYLHFSTGYRTNLASLTNISTIRSSSGIGLFGNGSQLMQNNSGSNANLDMSVYPEIVLDADMLVWLKRLLIKTGHGWACNGNSELLTVIAYLRLVLSVFVGLEPAETGFISELLTEQFVRYLLGMLVRHVTCNIVHNLVKDVIVHAIAKKYGAIVPVLLHPSAGLMIIASELNMKLNSAECQYEGQVYHIFQAIVKKCDDPASKILDPIKQSTDKLEDFLAKIKEKQKFYSRLICGDPRRQTSCWGDSSQDEKLFFISNNASKSKDLLKSEELNAGDIIEGKVEHWIDYEDLPLDSDQSKQQEFDCESMPLSKEQNKAKHKNDQFLPIPKENPGLAERFKDMGVKQCVEREIRIPKRNPNRATLSDCEPGPELLEQNSLNSKDQMQQQLEKEIKILQSKHFKTEQDDSQEEVKSPQIKIRVKNSIDDIQDNLFAKVLSEESVHEEKVFFQVQSEEEVVNRSLERSKQENKIKDSSKKDEKPGNEETKIPVRAVPSSDQQNIEPRLKEPPKKWTHDNIKQLFSTFPRYIDYQIEQILSQLQ